MRIPKTNWQSKMPELTKQIMKEHYKRNFEFVLSYMADDLVWIGPLDHQLTRGKEAFRRLLSPEQDTPIIVSDDQYFTVYSDKTSCTVVGTLTATTSPKSELLLMVRQRYTFQWVWQGDGPKVIHIHGSNPWEHCGKDEVFPYRLGKEAYDYIQQLHSVEHKTLNLKTIESKTVFITDDKIIYIEAENNHSVIHHLDGVVTVTTKISDMEAMLSKQFYRPHRCFLINIHYVISITRFEITMCDNIRIPVPEKKYLKVKQEIMQYQNDFIR